MIRKPSTKECLEYVIGAYSFLIPFGQTLTGTQYADLIGRHYDTRNPAIGCDCYLASRHIATIHRTHTATTAKFN